MNKNKVLLILILSIFVILLAAGGLGLKTNEESVNDSAPEESRKISRIQITVSIEGIISQQNLELPHNSSVLEALNKIATEEEIEIQTKKYAGLGTLVESIGEVSNGTNGKYWHYEVNDEIPLVEAENLVLSQSDEVRWFFAEPEEF